MPTLSPDSKRIAFVSNRNESGIDWMVRLWVADIDGQNARPVSIGTTGPRDLEHNGCILPIEQKAPAWSADRKSVAFLEGIEEVYMTFATKGQPPSSTDRDALIMSTWQVYVVDVDTGARRYAGRGDDPAWSPDNRLSRAYPDPSDQGPIVIIETAPYPDGTNWEELRVIPHPKTRGWGRMAWRGRSG